MFSLCYLRGFFVFEAEISQYYGLSEKVTVALILLFVFVLNVRSANSLINLPLTWTYWVLLLLLVKPPEQCAFDLSLCFPLLFLISVVRTTLLFLVHVCTHGILRKKLLDLKFRRSLFYLSPKFEDKKYTPENMPGRKTPLRALWNYFCFLLWVGILFGIWFYGTMFFRFYSFFLP